jgi:ankyrin repeat protein
MKPQGMKVVQKFKRAGADVSARDNLGNNPVHLAALNGHANVIKALRRAGADVSSRDNFQNTIGTFRPCLREFCFVV